jgi:hypothetical protein
VTPTDASCSSSRGGEDYWRHPDTDLDASVAAVIDDRPVAFSHLRIAPGGRAVTDMTGTLRDYRKLLHAENSF